MSLTRERQLAWNRLLDDPTQEAHDAYMALNLACYLAGELGHRSYAANCAAAARLDPRLDPREAKRVSP